MATTFATIRDQQSSVIVALTPSVRSDIKFREHLGEVPFIEWASANPNGALRRFSIRNEFDIEIGPTSDGSLEWWSHNETVLIAYPAHPALYGAQNDRDADDFIDSDLRQIDAAIGRNGSANYANTQHITELTGAAVQRGPDVWILAMVFKTQYDRST